MEMVRRFSFALALALIFSSGQVLADKPSGPQVVAPQDLVAEDEEGQGFVARGKALFRQGLEWAKENPALASVGTVVLFTAGAITTVKAKEKYDKRKADKAKKKKEASQTKSKQTLGKVSLPDDAKLDVSGLTANDQGFYEANATTSSQPALPLPAGHRITTKNIIHRATRRSVAAPLPGNPAPEFDDDYGVGPEGSPEGDGGGLGGSPAMPTPEYSGGFGAPGTGRAPMAGSALSALRGFAALAEDGGATGGAGPYTGDDLQDRIAAASHFAEQRRQERIARDRRQEELRAEKEKLEKTTRSLQSEIGKLQDAQSDDVMSPETIEAFQNLRGVLDVVEERGSELEAMEAALQAETAQAERDPFTAAAISIGKKRDVLQARLDQLAEELDEPDEDPGDSAAYTERLQAQMEQVTQEMQRLDDKQAKAFTDRGFAKLVSLEDRRDDVLARIQEQNDRDLDVEANEAVGKDKCLAKELVQKYSDLGRMPTDDEAEEVKVAVDKEFEFCLEDTRKRLESEKTEKLKQLCDEKGDLEAEAAKLNAQMADRDIRELEAEKQTLEAQECSLFDGFDRDDKAKAIDDQIAELNDRKNAAAAVRSNANVENRIQELEAERAKLERELENTDDPDALEKVLGLSSDDGVSHQQKIQAINAEVERLEQMGDKLASHLADELAREEAFWRRDIERGLTNDHRRIEKAWSVAKMRDADGSPMVKPLAGESNEDYGKRCIEFAGLCDEAEEASRPCGRFMSDETAEQVLEELTNIELSKRALATGKMGSQRASLEAAFRTARLSVPDNLDESSGLATDMRPEDALNEAFERMVNQENRYDLSRIAEAKRNASEHGALAAELAQRCEERAIAAEKEVALKALGKANSLRAEVKTAADGMIAEAEREKAQEFARARDEIVGQMELDREFIEAAVQHLEQAKEQAKKDAEARTGHQLKDQPHDEAFDVLDAPEIDIEVLRAELETTPKILPGKTDKHFVVNPKWKQLNREISRLEQQSDDDSSSVTTDGETSDEDPQPPASRPGSPHPATPPVGGLPAAPRSPSPEPSRRSIPKESALHCRQSTPSAVPTTPFNPTQGRGGPGFTGLGDDESCSESTYSTDFSEPSDYTSSTDSSSSSSSSTSSSSSSDTTTSSSSSSASSSKSRSTRSSGRSSSSASRPARLAARKRAEKRRIAAAAKDADGGIELPTAVTKAKSDSSRDGGRQNPVARKLTDGELGSNRPVGGWFEPDEVTSQKFEPTAPSAAPSPRPAPKRIEKIRDLWPVPKPYAKRSSRGVGSTPSAPTTVPQSLGGAPGAEEEVVWGGKRR